MKQSEEGSVLFEQQGPSLFIYVRKLAFPDAGDYNENIEYIETTKLVDGGIYGIEKGKI